MTDRAIRSLKRFITEATTQTEESQRLLSEPTAYGELNRLKELEIISGKLKTSERFIKEKQDLLTDALSGTSSEEKIAEINEILIQSDVVYDNLRTRIELIQTIIISEKEERDREREKEEREREKEDRDRNRNQNHELKLKEIESNERIQMEKINAEVELAKLKAQEFNDNDRNCCTVTTKLPKLNLSPFDGDILRWQSFWDSFQSAIHNNQGLTKIDKFNYLRSLLEGKASRTIDGLDLTSANYNVALDLLQQRFGKRSVILTKHYRALSDIPVSSKDTKGLRHTLDEIQVQLRSLKALGEEIETTSTVVTIQSKFPHYVLHELDFKRDGSNMWDVGDLLNNLERYISSKEITENSYGQNSKFHDKNKNTTFECASNKSPNSFRSTRSTCQALSSSQMSNQEMTSSKKCRYCTHKHWSDECRTYSTLEARKRKIEGSCYNCLLPGHRSSACNKKKYCYHCKKIGNHHRSLCPTKFSREIQPETASPVVDSGPVEESLSGPVEESLLAAGQETLMQTATTKVSNSDETNSTLTRIFFDTGSHRSYITEDLAKKLNLQPTTKQNLTIFTFATKEAKEIRTPVANVKLHFLDGTCATMTVNIVPQITGPITRVAINKQDLRNLPDIRLADSLPNGSNCSVQFLVGSDYYSDFLCGEKKELKPGLHALRSKFGWILTGRHGHQRTSAHENILFAPSLPNGQVRNASDSHEFFPDFTTDPKLNLENFWDLETLGIKDSIKETNDDKALQNFNENVYIENERYQVTWPWKDPVPNLQDNKELALGRLKSLIKRLKQEPENLNKYDAIIRDQLDRGVIEEVYDTEIENNNLQHYIPHHAVITPKKDTTKVRVVYDASAKTKKTNKSLNDCLYRGPVIMENLCGLLIRWRTHKIAIVADIEKAFLQVGLQPSERDVVRFFWIRDISKPVSQGNLVTYRFTRVPFGVVSSPFLLGATVTHHLQQVGSPTSLAIKENMYVDNLITGVDKSEDVENFYHETKEIFSAASMNIREWNSNWSDLKHIIPKCDKMDCDYLKVLGITWCLKDDSVIIDCPVNVSNGSLTKRIVLTNIAKLYDPLGLFTPLTLNAKLFLQEMWNRGQEWDEPATENQTSEWTEIITDLQNISSISIPRYIGITQALPQELELHCFCDASAKAFSTVVYLRISDSTGIHVHLLFAKGRLCPKKITSIPRLELMAALIGTRSTSFVEKQLRLPIKKITLWSDSQCVLHWIKSTKLLSPFVTNRIKEIKGHPFDYRYIISEQNPADMASRGVTMKHFRDTCNNIWWHGPEWLQQEKTCWPNFKFPELTHDSLQAVSSEFRGTKQSETCHLVEEGPERNFETEEKLDAKQFSSLTRLLRVTAWIRRFVNNLRGQKCLDLHLSSKEIIEARIFWERKVQQREFFDVYRNMKGGRRDKLQDQFGLFIDEQNILRCRNRMTNALKDWDDYAPKLLPRNHAFTMLVIEDIHKRLFHSGVSHTLSALRKEYWIPHGRATVKKVLKQCLICRKYEGGPFKRPQMPPWPKERVTKSPPFSFIGIDYLGPLYIRENHMERKVWICLFTCMAIRALHLELIPSLSAESFLFALRRFIGRRGFPREIISDNASYFKLTKSASERAWSNLQNNSDVKTYLSNHGITWHCITQFAPWQGGFYERLVGLVKKSLRKSIGKLTLSLDQLATLVTEIEAIINSRPLIYVGEEFESGHSIRPMDFLTMDGNKPTGYPLLDDSSNDSCLSAQRNRSTIKVLLDTWKRGQHHLKQFWEIWNREYLQSLQERASINHRRSKPTCPRSPACEEIVLIKENLPRGSWRLGRILSLNKGRDGCVRSADVKTSTGRTLTRPINFLFPLETSLSDSPSLSLHVPGPSNSQTTQTDEGEAENDGTPENEEDSRTGPS